MTRSAKLFLTVGLPGSGKTTRARELEQSHSAVRFTPDEWMIPLFGEAEADGGRDRMEGLLINIGLRALTIGTNVVLDFGLWGRDERTALRSLGADVGADVKVVYLPIDEATQRQRIHARFLARPEETFVMTRAEITQFRVQFEEPTADELAGGPVPGPPAEAETWQAWARGRWPTLGSH